MIELLEENIGVNFGVGNNVLDMTPKVQTTKKKVDK